MDQAEDVLRARDYLEWPDHPGRYFYSILLTMKLKGRLRAFASFFFFFLMCGYRTKLKLFYGVSLSFK